MRMRTGALTLVSLAFVMLASLVSATAWATIDCATDRDCPDGLVCQDLGAEPCPALPDCQPGSSCEEAPPCEPKVRRGCSPAPCVSDATCGGELICLTFTTTVCADAASCVPGAECPDAPSECTERSESFCAPRYLAPCAVGADCGDHFSCVETELCSCSGGVSQDGGDPVPPPECSCEKTGERSCQPEEILCAGGSGCPGGWSCEIAAAPGEDAPASSDGICMPPYWEAAGETMAEGPRVAMGDVSARDSSSGRGCQLASGTADAGSMLVGFAMLVLVFRRRRMAQGA